mmetsp:Transcript_20723/g.52625  ORF Transcript_20723/g.52625 Transcript_20723/m.52625 type:complete len:493 (+) Transcript_20723:691-2169(+)
MCDLHADLECARRDVLQAGGAVAASSGRVWPSGRPVTRVQGEVGVSDARVGQPVAKLKQGRHLQVAVGAARPLAHRHVGHVGLLCVIVVQRGHRQAARRGHAPKQRISDGRSTLLAGHPGTEHSGHIRQLQQRPNVNGPALQQHQHQRLPRAVRRAHQLLLRPGQPQVAPVQALALGAHARQAVPAFQHAAAHKQHARRHVLPGQHVRHRARQPVQVLRLDGGDALRVHQAHAITLQPACTAAATIFRCLHCANVPLLRLHHAMALLCAPSQQAAAAAASLPSRQPPRCTVPAQPRGPLLTLPWLAAAASRAQQLPDSLQGRLHGGVCTTSWVTHVVTQQVLRAVSKRPNHCELACAKLPPPCAASLAALLAITVVAMPSPGRLEHGGVQGKSPAPAPGGNLSIHQQHQRLLGSGACQPQVARAANHTAAKLAPRQVLGRLVCQRAHRAAQLQRARDGCVQCGLVQQALVHGSRYLVVRAITKQVIAGCDGH